MPSEDYVLIRIHKNIAAAIEIEHQRCGFKSANETLGSKYGVVHKTPHPKTRKRLAPA